MNHPTYTDMLNFFVEQMKEVKDEKKQEVILSLLFRLSVWEMYPNSNIDLSSDYHFIYELLPKLEIYIRGLRQDELTTTR